jgi:predicted O-methyltransferase YrrM
MSCYLQALRCLYGKGPVPLNYWLRCRSILKPFCRSPDPFFSARIASPTHGASLPVEDLAEFLRDDSLDGWALDGETITFLWDLLQREQPKVIIECGAGVSTLVFAKSLDGYSLDSSGSLLSVEQNLWVKKAVETRLQGCGLEQRVSVMHSPVSRGGEYQIDPNQLRAHLGSKKVDWLVIDGPAGPDGCRASTLPSLAQFCRPGARWFLDDAYRDGELEVLNQWTGLTGVVVDGIYPIGKGLGTGIVTDPCNVGEITLANYVR